MAILGGAGNPVGGSFTGPAEALEIIGDHAYAYSGQIQIDTNPVEHLSFTSGNFYLVGSIASVAASLSTNPGQGAASLFSISFNGVEVNVIKTSSIDPYDQAPFNAIIPIVIPPYTEVKVTVDSTVDTATMKTSCNITGRIYRTRD